MDRVKRIDLTYPLQSCKFARRDPPPLVPAEQSLGWIGCVRVRHSSDCSADEKRMRPFLYSATDCRKAYICEQLLNGWEPGRIAVVLTADRVGRNNDPSNPPHMLPCLAGAICLGLRKTQKSRLLGQGCVETALGQNPGTNSAHRSLISGLRQAHSACCAATPRLPTLSPWTRRPPRSAGLSCGNLCPREGEDIGTPAVVARLHYSSWHPGHKNNAEGVRRRKRWSCYRSVFQS